MAQKKRRKLKAARNRTIARKRAQQLKDAQERKQRTRYSRRRQLIDAAKRRKKAVKYYRSLKQATQNARRPNKRPLNSRLAYRVSVGGTN